MANEKKNPKCFSRGEPFQLRNLEAWRKDRDRERESFRQNVACGGSIDRIDRNAILTTISTYQSTDNNISHWKRSVFCVSLLLGELARQNSSYVSIDLNIATNRQGTQTISTRVIWGDSISAYSADMRSMRNATAENIEYANETTVYRRSIWMKLVYARFCQSWNCEIFASFLYNLIK